MKKIFISYKRVDHKKVFAIKQGIEEATGMECWVDLDGIESDAQFKQVIIKAIDDCEVLLFMYSKEHAAITDFENDWTMRELNYAAHQKKRIVFINIDGTPLTNVFVFDYGTKQQVDGQSKAALAKLYADLRTWLVKPEIVFEPQPKPEQTVTSEPGSTSVSNPELVQVHQHVNLRNWLLGMSKVLYVGLGGFGAGVVLSIKKNLVEEYGAVPADIGFLAIDTDSRSLLKESQIANGQNVRLDPEELLICSMGAAQQLFLNDPDSFAWFPHCNLPYLGALRDTGVGAGAIRTNGRMFAQANDVMICHRIQSALNTIMPNLFQKESPLEVRLVSSVAGGTGSGMLIDVLCMVQQEIQEMKISNARITPWLVMPECFCAHGPSTFHCVPNAYSTLQELDYIYNADSESPVQWGKYQLDPALLSPAMIVGANKKNGMVLQLDQIMEEVSDCMLNTRCDEGWLKTSDQYNVRNKKAWCMSVGYAELVYDPKVVARAKALAMKAQLADSLLRFPGNSGSLIQHYAADNGLYITDDAPLYDLPDYCAPVSIYIDRMTTADDIRYYIDNVSGTAFREDLKRYADDKLQGMKSSYSQYISNVFRNTPQGGLSLAISFSAQLRASLSSGIERWQKELEQLPEIVSQEPDWGTVVEGWSRLRTFLFPNRFREKAETLEATLRSYVENIRKELIIKSAISIFQQLVLHIGKTEPQLIELEGILKSLAEESRTELHSLDCARQYNRISLHEADLKAQESFVVSKIQKSTFVAFLVDNLNLEDDMCSEERVRKLFDDFAYASDYVQSDINLSAEEALQRLSAENFNTTWHRLRNLAVPMWMPSTEAKSLPELSEKVVVGVEDSRDTIFNYSSLRSEKNAPSLVSTGHKNRIFVQTTEGFLPVFAMRSLPYYRSAEEERPNHATYATYVDEGLHNRMQAEHFDIQPQ